MLVNAFDYTVAVFVNFAAINPTEVAQADLVRIGEYHPAGIYHSQKMRWKGSLLDISEPTGLIRSQKERKAIAENKLAFESEGYYFKTVPFTGELYEEFVELYANTTQQKNRWIPVNLKEQILGKIMVESPVYLVGMFKNRKIESGLVFSLKGEEAIVSVGAKKKFPEKRGGVGGVLEVELVQHCLTHNLTEINHGVDQNPAGISVRAGIFEFKARYGFSAFPEGKWQTTFILSQKPALSDLVFITLQQNKLHQIILSDSSEDLTKRYQTTHVPASTQLSLQDIIQHHRAFLLGNA